MNPIDRLCELLDERGVEYKHETLSGLATADIEFARWKGVGGLEFNAIHSHSDPEKLYVNDAIISPEDVVRVTLGEKVTGETSDGYHTFNELYHHRAVLFSVIVHDHSDLAWKSKRHHDGTMYDGMFIVGIETPEGQATYHYDVDPYWDMFDCKELESAPEWDGHTPDDAIARIGSLASITDDSVMGIDYECDEYPEGRWWRCEGCGQRFLYERGYKPCYCPECGRTRRQDQ